MTLIDTVRHFYNNNVSELNLYLEETSFLDINSKYPNSVVIKFGKNKLQGEIAVWQNDETESYYECEYFDLTNLKIEPVYSYKQITIESVISELKLLFNTLYKKTDYNFR